MLRSVNVELVCGINYTYVSGVSSNNCQWGEGGGPVVVALVFLVEDISTRPSFQTTPFLEYSESVNVNKTISFT